jgi:hypothetical protein
MSTSHIDRMETIDVFSRIDGIEDFRLMICLGRGLNEDPMDLRILIVSNDQLKQLFLGDARGLIVLNRMEPQLLGGFLFGGDIADRGRVFAHQDRH